MKFIYKIILLIGVFAIGLNCKPKQPKNDKKMTITDYFLEIPDESLPKEQLERQKILDTFKSDMGKEENKQKPDTWKISKLDARNGFISLGRAVGPFHEIGDQSIPTAHQDIEIVYWTRKGKPDLVGIVHGSIMIGAQAGSTSVIFYEFQDGEFKEVTSQVIDVKKWDNCHLPQNGTDITICGIGFGPEHGYKWDGDKFNFWEDQMP